MQQNEDGQEVNIINEKVYCIEIFRSTEKIFFWFNSSPCNIFSLRIP